MLNSLFNSFSTLAIFTSGNVHFLKKWQQFKEHMGTKALLTSWILCSNTSHIHMKPLRPYHWSFFNITLPFTLHLHYKILQYIILLFSKHLNIIIKLGILKLTDEGGALTLTEASVALTRDCPIFFL